MNCIGGPDNSESNGCCWLSPSSPRDLPQLVCAVNNLIGSLLPQISAIHLWKNTKLYEKGRQVAGIQAITVTVLPAEIKDFVQRDRAKIHSYAFHIESYHLSGRSNAKKLR